MKENILYEFKKIHQFHSLMIVRQLQAVFGLVIQINIEMAKGLHFSFFFFVKELESRQRNEKKIWCVSYWTRTKVTIIIRFLFLPFKYQALFVCVNILNTKCKVPFCSKIFSSCKNIEAVFSWILSVRGATAATRDVGVMWSIRTYVGRHIQWNCLYMFSWDVIG